MSAYDEGLKIQAYKILKSAFYEVYGRTKPIAMSQKMAWLEESARYNFTLYINTGTVLQKLVQNGIIKRDILEAKAELLQSGTFARSIFTTKEYSNSTYNISIAVKPWGEVQIGLTYSPQIPREVEELKKAIRPVIAEFKDREVRYNNNAPQLERDVVALTIAAKLKAVVAHDDAGVSLDVGLMRTSPQTFITEVLAGLPENVPEEARKNLQGQLLKGFKAAELKLICPRRVDIKLDWAAAKTLAGSNTRFRDIEPANPPRTQASRG